MTVQVDYYVSLNSPWTHLGARRIEAITEQYGATLRIFPVDLGTIFPASGGLPLPKRSPQRQAYRLQDLARWRDYLGVPINLKPRHFPADDKLSSACVLAVRETIGNREAVALAHGVLKAVWEEERDPGNRDVLADLVRDVGLDPSSILLLAAEDRWAEQRARESQAALQRGVFGAPTYVIGDEIFWGQDRLEFVTRLLARVT
jgi:carboxymethylenebutenolidase